MARTEIRITGFGGQGVILCGYVLGKAAAIGEGLHATMVQSFGPEARGSACAAMVVVSDDQVDYPYVQSPQILVALSKDAYKTYRSDLKPGTTLLYEADLVTPEDHPGARLLGVPATRLAEKVGKRIVVNIVMIGFFAATTTIVKPEALREAVRTSVPAGTEGLNLRAFDAGFEYGRELMAPAAAAAATA